MSDDLISRKALMDKVLQEEYDNDIHKDGRAKAIHHGEYQHFYRTISEMPTAYDVDKVVEEIEDTITPTAEYRYKFCGTVEVGRCASYESCECCIAERMIEIVKSVGVAND